MIHIATSHHRDPRWIPIQLRALRRHTSGELRLYASLYGIDPRFRAEFDHVLDHSRTPRGGSPNAVNMTRLGEQMVARAEPDDIVVFMHGDTFPVADWVPAVREMLAGAPLAAVQRRENLEPIPHESFCATTAGYWSEVGGRWASGPTWESDGRTVTDTGATLWRTLEDRGAEWRPILRSNAKDLHPLWFAVYGDLVYHHGAGFRSPMSRRDVTDFSHLPVPVRNVAGVRRRIANSRLSRRVYRRLADEDDDFPRELMAAG